MMLTIEDYFVLHRALSTYRDWLFKKHARFNHAVVGRVYAQNNRLEAEYLHDFIAGGVDNEWVLRRLTGKT